MVRDGVCCSKGIDVVDITRSSLIGVSDVPTISLRLGTGCSRDECLQAKMHFPCNLNGDRAYSTEG